MWERIVNRLDGVQFFLMGPTERYDGSTEKAKNVRPAKKHGLRENRVE